MYFAVFNSTGSRLTALGAYYGLRFPNGAQDKRSTALEMLANGYTQKAIAELLGVHRNTIRNWGLRANRTKTYGKRKIIVLKID
ncbi:helix-turn-helix domain-containing protein [Escherichia coli]|uniref:helix-turn-helix domain-containing protein n=1 Tax=Escherichia coli TaxID=562 RepID=UPI000DD2C7EE|nr:helix-turn-helix domain-containing protein [Escherichia coli]MBB9275652.1 helix-turn-helix domain-containing protein [Escherichia coli]MCH6982373.1 helix-turn-helix domain-containing protein [Escherichia coli]MCQ0162147.1 helix-turn-helix domain-containing protein [Escherichia coli]MCQ0181425.1 helix-turn-helix domain-containing protein [Escherichia coli]